MPNITVKRCNVLNPATLLPTADDDDPHCCISELAHVCPPQFDFSEQPLPNPDLILYVDGSAFRHPAIGQNQVGFAVVSAHDVFKQLNLLLSQQRTSVRALPEPAVGLLNKLQPGDFVVIRNFTRKNWSHQKGPYQVLLMMYPAMKIAERATWVHASHCKEVPGPEGSPAH